VKNKYKALGMTLAVSSLSLMALSLDIAPALAATALNPYPAIKLAGPSHPTVYLERNGTLHAVGTESEFFDMGYSFSQVHDVGVLPEPVDQPAMLFRQVSHPQVYLMYNGELHWISSVAMLESLGYNFNDVYRVSALPASVGAPERAVPSVSSPPILNQLRLRFSLYSRSARRD
jgi:hypothetical protein